MQEIRKITIQDQLNHDKDYRHFYYWVARRLPSMQLISALFLCAIIYAYLELYFFWKNTGIIPYKHCVMYFLSIIFIFCFQPWVRFKIDSHKSNRTYGKKYELVINATGIQVNNKYISLRKRWKKIENEHGIAIIYFNRVQAIFLKKSFSPKEITMLQDYIKHY